VHDTLPRLVAADSVLVVVDVQDKLLAAMPRAAELVRNVGFLLDVAALVEVPFRASEQYPKGLGPTTAEIARRLPADVPAKTAFSCCGAAGFLAELRTRGRRTVVLAGIETHVCIAQTALDLLEVGFRVFLPVDGVSSRFPIDHDTAIRRLERVGVVPTTVEAVAFEWVGDAAHPQFKAVSKLVIGRGENDKVTR
jgi:nicotinamidase-related amidase